MELQCHCYPNLEINNFFKCLISPTSLPCNKVSFFFLRHEDKFYVPEEERELKKH